MLALAAAICKRGLVNFQSSTTPDQWNIPQQISSKKIRTKCRKRALNFYSRLPGNLIAHNGGKASNNYSDNSGSVGSGNNKSSLSRANVSAQFSAQLRELRERIDRTSPHYVRWKQIWSIYYCRSVAMCWCHWSGSSISCHVSPTLPTRPVP